MALESWLPHLPVADNEYKAEHLSSFTQLIRSHLLLCQGLKAVGKGAAEGVDKLAETMMGTEAKAETAQAIGTLAR